MDLKSHWLPEAGEGLHVVPDLEVGGFLERDLVMLGSGPLEEGACAGGGELKALD